MSSTNSFKDIFHSLFKDGKIIFIILATLLISLSIITPYILKDSILDLYVSLIIGATFAFSYVVIAWAITDKSIIRKPVLYLAIFIVLFFEKIYRAMFYKYFPSNTVINSDYFFIIVKFLTILFFLTIFWYLARPKDFTQTDYKLSYIFTKRMFLIVLSAFFMTMPIWIWNALEYFGGTEFVTRLLINSNISWYNFLMLGIPNVMGIGLLAVIITNIKNQSRYLLLLAVFIFTLIPFLPWPDFINFTKDTYYVFQIFYFIVVAISYFIVFLSLVLLSKPKYLEE